MDFLKFIALYCSGEKTISNVFCSTLKFKVVSALKDSIAVSIFLTHEPQFILSITKLTFFDITNSKLRGNLMLLYTPWGYTSIRGKPLKSARSHHSAGDSCHRFTQKPEIISSQGFNLNEVEGVYHTRAISDALFKPGSKP